MSFNFPASPSEGQEYAPAGGPVYVYEAPRWTLKPVAAGVSGPPDWRQVSHNNTGTITANPGTRVVAGANNTYGSSVAILPALAHDVEYLVIIANRFAVSTADGSTALDILIDPAGGTAWAATPLIANLLVGEVGNASGWVGYQYHFPLAIAAGASIAARARWMHTAVISTVGEVMLFAYGDNANPGSWWCGSSVSPIGLHATAAYGTMVTSGVNSAYGSWTNLGAPLATAAKALQFFVQGTNSTITQNAANYRFEFGIAGAAIAPPIYKVTNTTEVGQLIPVGLFFYDAPAGTQFQVRGACSAATAQILNVVGYAVHE